MAFGAEIYVDPSIDADSGTGTIGDPYGDLEYALAQTTHSGSSIRFNIKAGTAEVLSAVLNPAATITTGQDYPCVFEGYTSTAGDGGQGEIQGTTNSVAILDTANTIEYFGFRNLKMTAGNTGFALDFTKFCTVLNCEIINANGGGITSVNGYQHVIGCTIRYGGTSMNGFECGSSGRSYVCGNYIIATSTTASHGIALGNSASIYNIIDLSATTGASVHGFNLTQNLTTIVNNTVIGGSGAGCFGIDFNTNAPGPCFNNYFEGFTGSGSKAIEEPTETGLVLMHNKYYNCANGFPTNNTFVLLSENNGATTASGLLNLAANNFTPTDELRGLGYPSSWNNLSGNASYIDIGAVQVPSA